MARDHKMTVIPEKGILEWRSMILTRLWTLQISLWTIMQDVAGNSEAIILDRLSPGTQYSITVTAIWLGKKYRSRQIVFRTLDIPKPLSQQDLSANGMLTGVITSNVGMGSGGNLSNGRPPGISNGSETSGDDGAGITSTATNTLSQGTPRELPTIRGVEIGIVLIVLMVWAGAIALFFNRWGKIRMLLPYQPDYKHEQLKVPGTGVCSGGVCNGQHSHQHFHFFPEEHSTSISERITRSRINSAIFVSSEGRGFDSIEFLRRHGSQSVLCRKAKSAENIMENDRKKSFSEKRQWHTDDNNDTGNDSDAQNEYGIELQECSRSVENHPITALKSNVEKLLAATTVLGHSAAVTTSNRIRSSTVSPALTQSQALNSPKAIKLKCLTPKISNLPMVSVSGPSPPDEKPPPPEYL
uniref:Fibronectin type III domain-containing protein n=1 Tax=Glossina brevipalpis TaxID=37001 RepID=A0A1A9X3X1_9MUSC